MSESTPGTTTVDYIDDKDDPFWQEATKRSWAVPDRPLGVEDIREIIHSALLHGAKMGIAAQQSPPKLHESVEFQSLWSTIEAFAQAGKQTDRSAQVASVNAAITVLITAFRRITITTRVNPKIAPKRINDAYETGRVDGQLDAINVLDARVTDAVTRRGELQMELITTDATIEKAQRDRDALMEGIKKLREERKAEEKAKEEETG